MKEIIEAQFEICIEFRKMKQHRNEGSNLSVRKHLFAWISWINIICAKVWNFQMKDLQDSFATSIFPHLGFCCNTNKNEEEELSGMWRSIANVFLFNEYVETLDFNPIDMLYLMILFKALDEANSGDRQMK